MKASLVLLLLTATTALGQLQWEAKRVELTPSLTDTNAVARFSFKNTGKKSVTLASVTSSCDCWTVAKLERTTYKPGEKGEIRATFDIGGRKGLQDKTILVKSNDLKEPTTLLTLRVRIPEALRITPTAVFWHSKEKKDPKVISLDVADGATIHVLKVRSSEARIRAELQEVRRGKAYRLIVTPTDLSRSVIADLRIETDWPRGNPRAFNAYAHIHAASQGSKRPR